MLNRFPSKELVFFCILTYTDYAVGKNFQSSDDIPEVYRESVISAQELGTAIYVQDIAAWVSTDELIERGIVKRDQRIRGWVSTQYTDFVRVMFIGAIGEKLLGLYAVDVKDGQVVKGSFSEFSNGRELSDIEMGMFLARQLGLKSHFKRCSNTYNTVVFPIIDSDESTNGFLVYLLAATTESNKIPLGGHVRIEISMDELEILELTHLSKSCLLLEKEDTTEAIVVNNLVSETPSEIHVFLSLQHRTPIIVLTMTNNITWLVRGADISILDGG